MDVPISEADKNSLDQLFMSSDSVTSSTISSNAYKVGSDLSKGAFMFRGNENRESSGDRARISMNSFGLMSSGAKSNAGGDDATEDNSSTEPSALFKDEVNHSMNAPKKAVASGTEKVYMYMLRWMKYIVYSYSEHLFSLFNRYFTIKNLWIS